MRKFIMYAISALVCLSMTGCSNETTSASVNKKVTLVLDYVTNTNHTGIYVAQNLGYFKEEGLEVEIIEPGDTTTSAAMVATNKGQFGVSYQEDVTYAKTAEEAMPIKAIATIMQHNTSGFVALKASGITSPKDFEGHVYAGWQSLSEEAVIKAVMKAENADIGKLTMVGSDGSGFASLGKGVDIQWVFEGWDLIKANAEGYEYNYMPLNELDERLDYYTPVIITNDEMLNNDKETVQKFMNAVKKGYEYAIEKPNESAEILHTYIPDYDIEYLKESQNYVSQQYARDSEIWGLMKDSVWDNYTSFMFENGLISTSISASQQYTNEFLK